MSVSDLLKDIEEQKEERSLVIDGDSQIFKSCYRYKDTEDIELMYIDFFMQVSRIEAEIWKHYQIKETVIALTSKKNFRHDLTDKWKADRVKDTTTMNDKQLEAHTVALQLKRLVSKVKALLNERMSNMSNYRVDVSMIAEADDRSLDLANQGWIVATIDSDVISQSKSPVFNYHTKHWKFIHQGLTQQEINKGILYGSMVSHNGDFGVKGYGKVKAKKFLDRLFSTEQEDDEIDFNSYVDLFDTPFDMLLNVRLSSCHQVYNNELKLLEVKDIEDMLLPF